MRRIRSVRAAIALAVVVAAVALTGPPSAARPAAPEAPRPAATAAAPTAPTAPAAQDSVASAAIDPAMDPSWPRWRFQVQNPSNRSRLVLDVYFSGGHGTPVQLWGDNSGEAQLWYEERAAEGGVFLHPAYDRWLCLGVNSTGWGSPVMVQNCNGSANQRWVIEYKQEFHMGGREIRSVPENLCLDVPGSNYAVGQALQIWGCNHTPAQRWVRPPMARGDSRTEPVYFVPGFTYPLPFTGPPRHDCWNGYWRDAVNAMRSWGWTFPSYRLVGFYDNDDPSCDTKLIEGDLTTPISELGRLLAWDIYLRYSVRHVSVDVMAHSMGGLVTRAAIAGVRQGSSEGNGWPPYLYVEDVVTLGTPHAGTGVANACIPVKQCVDMVPNSLFLQGLPQNPQSTQGTDWTAIGSEQDDIVSVDSAVSPAVGHKVKYLGDRSPEHNRLNLETGGSWNQAYWNYTDPNWWYVTSSGAPTIRSAANALYYWNAW